MSDAQSIRNYLNLLEAEDLIVVAMALTEGEIPERIDEGWIADRVKAAASQIAQKFGDLNYALLARLTMQATRLFAAKRDMDPAVGQVLDRILRVGKLAVANRQLLGILIGIVGTLAGLASNPAAAAQTAAKLAPALEWDQLDDIIENLRDYAIEYMDTPTTGLPKGLGDMAETAARTLRAIEDFTYDNGKTTEKIAGTGLQEFSIDGVVSKKADVTFEHIRVTTLGGDLVLADIQTKVTMVNGQPQTHVEVHGVQPTLNKAFEGLPKETVDKIQRYIQAGVNAKKGIKEEVGPNITVAAVMADKADDIARLVADAVADRGDGTYRVRIGKNGIKIEAR